MPPSDHDFLERLRHRDASALAELYERYADRLYRLGRRILHDSNTADDIVQTTFMALIESIDNFEGRASIGTWLYRVAYNEALALLRARQPVPLFEETDDISPPQALCDWSALPEDAADHAEAAGQIDAAMEALPPVLRAVFQLRDVDDLSTRDTAEALGMTETAVKVALHRARLRLREHLSAYFIEYRA
ncbi:MAG: RNA polymerase sigma factor [Chloroflexi bacterium]|nr:RNA polymerase sigma factor [Chloroflexota bacterium]